MANRIDADAKIAYLDHPVNAEAKAEYIAKGLKIIDSIFDLNPKKTLKLKTETKAE